MATPQTNAPEWAASQETPWLTENQAKRIFDAFAVKAAIEDRDLTEPPLSCADGDRFLIAAPATGDWIGRDGQMAIAFGTDAGSGWVYAAVAREGNQLYVRDEALLIEYFGAAWNIAPDRITAFGDLSDVDFSGGIADGDTILYDLSNGVWYAGPAGMGTVALDDLTDVLVSMPQDGDALVYEASSGLWVPTQISNGGSGVVSGSSFPGGPASGDRFYRTDRNIDYYYDGTSWLSTEIFLCQFDRGNGAALSVTTPSLARQVNSWADLYDIYALEGVFSAFISTTGNWTLTISHVTGVTTTSFVSGTLSTAAAWSSVRTAINAVLAKNLVEFEASVTENSGASTIVPCLGFTYRLIG
jgi:hypothetical protein